MLVGCARLLLPLALAMSFFGTAMAVGGGEARGAARSPLLRIVSVGQGSNHLTVDQRTHRVFVFSDSRNRVLVLDGQTGTPLRTTLLPTHASTTGASVDSSTGRVFLSAVITRANQTPGPPLTTGMVYTLDGRTGAVLDSVAISHQPAGELGNIPVSVDIDPRAGHAFVIRQDGALITVDTRTLRVLRFAWAEGQPIQVAVDDRTGRVFVVSNGGMMPGVPRSVSMFDAGSGALIRRIAAACPSGQSPAGPGETASGIAIDQRVGKLYVSTHCPTMRHDRITVLDARAGSVLRRLNIDGQGPMAVDGHLHRLFVLSKHSNAGPFGDTLTAVDIRQDRLIGTAHIGYAALALAVDRVTNRVFVVNGRTRVVSVFDAWSARHITDVRVGRPLGGANSMDIGVDAGISRAFVLDSAGRLSVLTTRV
jgi:DNA-binding beta-propeller fold protein YncE